MTFDWDTFQTAYLAASEETKELIDSDSIANCIEYQIGFKTIDESYQSTVKTLCAFHVLKLLSTEEVTREMQTLGIPNAGEIFTTLQNCMQNAKGEAPESVESTPVPIPPAPTDLTSEIKEAEAAIQAIPKIKTMAQDAQAASMYSSSQESILNNRGPQEPS